VIWVVASLGGDPFQKSYLTVKFDLWSIRGFHMKLHRTYCKTASRSVQCARSIEYADYDVPIVARFGVFEWPGGCGYWHCLVPESHHLLPFYADAFVHVKLVKVPS
jgi:hypothetical protein